MADNSDAESEQEGETEFEVGSRYRLTDDGTVYEVVGVTVGEVDVVQYDEEGEVQGEHTFPTEEFHREIVEPAR